jgi:hypothetical protein
MKRTCTFVPVTMHALQQMDRDRNACRARAVTPIAGVEVVQSVDLVRLARATSA